MLSSRDLIEWSQSTPSTNCNQYAILNALCIPIPATGRPLITQLMLKCRDEGLLLFMLIEVNLS